LGPLEEFRDGHDNRDGSASVAYNPATASATPAPFRDGRSRYWHQQHTVNVTETPALGGTPASAPIQPTATGPIQATVLAFAIATVTIPTISGLATALPTPATPALRVNTTLAYLGASSASPPPRIHCGQCRQHHGDAWGALAFAGTVAGHQQSTGVILVTGANGAGVNAKPT
jgi:hypothetical protein